MRFHRIGRLAAGLLCTAALCGVPAAAQNAADRHFLEETLATNQAEIRLGHMAEQKSSDEDIQGFGKRLVRDHTELNEQFEPIAKEAGVVDNAMTQPEKAAADRLEGLSGKAFDEAFLRVLVQEHRAAIERFRKEMATTQDSTLRAAAENGLPMLQQHLQIAENLARAAGVNVEPK